ncbi:MAG: hypothetical protein K6C36_03950 [Clostridia bacterium]|nr:hypothetical protein [Clostridia bacterium]
MIELSEVMSLLYKNIREPLAAYGFQPVFVPDAPRGSVPAFDRGENSKYLDFVSEDKGRVRLVYNNNRMLLLTGEKDISTADDRDFTLSATYLCELEEYEQRDIMSISNEIVEHFNELYDPARYAPKKAAVSTVSKTAAKSGALLYDPITLAVKLGGMYPTFKDKINENNAMYGEFLFEEFFENYGNAFILDTIRENDPKKMKKLFGILGEIYDDGSNEVQSLIVVTILGALNDDPILMQNILPYISDVMLEPTLAVNKYLAKNKSARLRLSNPPKYKPKKQKSNKKNPLSSLLGI